MADGLFNYLLIVSLGIIYLLIFLILLYYISSNDLMLTLL
jgi:hypothetical protein